MLAWVLHKIPQGLSVSVHVDTYSTYKLAQVLHGMTQENWCIEGSSIHLRHGYIFATFVTCYKNN